MRELVNHLQHSIGVLEVSESLQNKRLYSVLRPFLQNFDEEWIILFNEVHPPLQEGLGNEPRIVEHSHQQVHLIVHEHDLNLVQPIEHVRTVDGGKGASPRFYLTNQLVSKLAQLCNTL